MKTNYSRPSKTGEQRIPAPRKFSPSWYWQQIGATVERDQHRRTVMIGNRVLCKNAGYDREEKMARRIYKLAGSK